MPTTDRLITLFGERRKMIRHHMRHVYAGWRIRVFNGLFASSVLFKEMKSDCVLCVCLMLNLIVLLMQYVLYKVGALK